MVAKTSACYIVVTVHPYPNRQPFVIFDARMAKKAKAHGVSILRRLDVRRPRHAFVSPPSAIYHPPQPLTAFPSEVYSDFAVLYLRRFFEGFRCRLRPQAVCILYKPRETSPPGLPLPGGTVYEGLFFTAAESRAYGRREFHCQRHLSI